MNQKFLAVVGAGDKVFIEDNQAAISHALVNEVDSVKYYPISVDEDGNPSLGGAVSLSDAPRRQARRIERAAIVSDGVEIGEVEVAVELDAD